MFLLAILLFLAGFLFPPLWILAVLCAVFGVAGSARPARADGKERTGGVLGGLVDTAAMGKCHFCLMQIPRAAKKCGHCGEWQPEPEPAPPPKAADMGPMEMARKGLRPCPNKGCGGVVAMGHKTCDNCGGAV